MGYPTEPIGAFTRAISAEVEPGSDAWFALRSGKATASNFHKVMARDKSRAPDSWGLTAHGYAREVAAEIVTGLWFEGYSNEYMNRGTELEQEAKAYYEQVFGESIEPIGFVLMDDMIGGTPDGWIEPDCTVQIKCHAKHHIHIDYLLDGKVPSQYVKQVQGEMMVTGARRAMFISYHPDFELPEHRIVRIVVKRDEEYIAAMYERLVAFKGIVGEYVTKLKQKRI